jgi:predicted negative regulator of RcsB-dependent stress response
MNGKPGSATAKLQAVAGALLAQIAFSEKQFGESLKLIENILFRDPANIEARLLQAQVWLAKGDSKKAVKRRKIHPQRCGAWSRAS